MQDGSPINIYSVFRSINGEVNQSGQGSWATFIRFAGCNLRCSWCDTKYAQETDSGTIWPIDKIMQAVYDSGCRNVTITGGEPLMQREELRALIRALLIHKFHVSIETNGSIPIIQRTYLHHSHLLSWVVDYKLPSSEQVLNMGGVKPWTQLNKMDYIKFVIANRMDYDVALSIVQRFYSEGVEAQMVFSPIVDSPASRPILHWMQDNQLFRIPVSYQIHKLVNWDEPK